MEPKITRRGVLKTVMGTTAGLGTLLTHTDRVLGANDRVRVAICGLNGRGKDHIHGFSQVSNVEIAALCDVDENVLRKRQGEVDGKPQTYVDIRKMLEDRSIDAISIATPNHWHALMAIWACQAGKDVYVEKPCSHNLEESVPAGIHYDLWTGPAPLKPFTRNRFHHKWHWNWDTGNGDLGNQGVHQIDVARWGLGVQFPTRISAVGGHFMFDDDQQTPNTLNCAFAFDLPGGGRKMLEFEVRHWITNNEAGIGRGDLATGMKRFIGRHDTIGNVFYGSNGYLATGDEDATSYEMMLGRDQKSRDQGHGGGNHFVNFIECVRSRDKENLTAPIREGHISCALVHLANASYRLGRTLLFNSETERVIEDEEANELLCDANRGYRTPFVVPKDV